MNSINSSYRIFKLKNNENYNTWKINIFNFLKIKELWWITSKKMKKSEDLDKEISAEIKLIYEIKLFDWKDKND